MENTLTLNEHFLILENMSLSIENQIYRLNESMDDSYTTLDEEYSYLLDEADTPKKENKFITILKKIGAAILNFLKSVWSKISSFFIWVGNLIKTVINKIRGKKDVKININLPSIVKARDLKLGVKSALAKAAAAKDLEEKEKLIDELSKANIEFKEANEKANKENADLSAKNADLSGKFEDANKVLALLTKENEDDKKYIADLKAELEKVKKEVDRLTNIYTQDTAEATEQIKKERELQCKIMAQLQAEIIRANQAVKEKEELASRVAKAVQTIAEVRSDSQDYDAAMQRRIDKETRSKTTQTLVNGQIRDKQSGINKIANALGEE